MANECVEVAGAVRPPVPRGDVRVPEHEMQRTRGKGSALLLNDGPCLALDLGVQSRRRTVAVAADAQLEPVGCTLSMPAQKCQARSVEVERRDSLPRSEGEGIGDEVFTRDVERGG